MAWRKRASSCFTADTELSAHQPTLHSSQLLFCPKSFVLVEVPCERARLLPPPTQSLSLWEEVGASGKQHARRGTHSCVASGVMRQVPPQVNLHTGPSRAHVWSDTCRAEQVWDTLSSMLTEASLTVLWVSSRAVLVCAQLTSHTEDSQATPNTSPSTALSHSL